MKKKPIIPLYELRKLIERVDSGAQRDTPQKVDLVVKQAFNHSVNLVRQATRREMLVRSHDLAGEWRRRREKVAIDLMPRVRSRYQQQYPELNIEEVFARISARMTTSYDILEYDSSITLGAAVWILDRLRESGGLYRALPLLPRSAEALDEAEMPAVWDCCHDEDLLRAMVYVIQHRNEDLYAAGRYKRGEKLMRCLADECAAGMKALPELPSRSRFLSVLALLDEEAVAAAARHFEEKQWQWLDLYFEGEAGFERELTNMARSVERAVRDTQIADLPLPASPSDLLPGLGGSAPERMPEMDELFAKHVDSGREVERWHRKILGIHKRFTALCDRQERFRSLSWDHGDRTEACMAREVGEEAARLLTRFTVEDPFEICFAVVYLLDARSELPWNYTAGIAVVNEAAMKLPWCGIGWEENREENREEDWPSEPEEAPPSDAFPDWYALNYSAEALSGSEWEEGEDEEVEEGGEDEEEDPDAIGLVSLAQILYDLTGTLAPRRLDRLAPARQRLLRAGVPPHATAQVIQCAAMLEHLSYPGPRWSPEEEHTPPPPTPELDAEAETLENLRAECAALRQENEALRRENGRLEQAGYSARREAREVTEKYEKLSGKAQEERQELAYLREVVFAQQAQETPEPEQETPVSFPYTVTHRTVVFGGHDSWAREIKPKLPGVRFVDRSALPNADIIRHADVVWIQSNAMAHKHYYKIIHEARTYSIPVRYFTCASAERCAVQLAAQDRKGFC